MNKELTDKLDYELNDIYNSTNFKNVNVDEELGVLYDKFNDRVLNLLEKYKDEAYDYYKKREEFTSKVVDPVNEKVKKILLDLKREYNEKYSDDFKYQVASSYSAKMNLIGESDIDYFILFKPLTEERLIKMSQLITRKGFDFQKTVNPDRKNNLYYAFETVIDGVEVEFKVRDFYYSRNVIDLHQFIDEKLDQHVKVLLTYAKHQLKLRSKEDKNFKGYNMFKTLFYNYCFKGIEDAFYIIA